MNSISYYLKFVTTFGILICFLNIGISQGFGMKFIPLDFATRPINLWEQNDKLYVSSINNINNISGSTIIELNYNLDTLSTYFYPNILLGRNSPQLINNELFGYCGEIPTNNKLLLVAFDDEFRIIRRDSFYSDADNFSINSMNQLDGEIIGVGIDENVDCEILSCYEMNIKTIDTEGSQLSSFNLDKDQQYFFSSKNSTTSDNHILIGGINFAPYATASLFKVSSDGDVIWNYKSYAKSSRGNIPINTLELSNGNIVYTDKLDKNDDDEYIALGYTNRPNQLVWLSPEGDSLMSYLDTVSWRSGTEYNGITPGNGDYFFVYGDYGRGSFPVDSLDGEYGFIMKMSNDGNIIWRRSYHIGENLDYGSYVNQLIELENGDIITVGIAVAFPSLKTWMMHLDENGCFGEGECGEIYLATNSVDIPVLDKEDKDLFYPIPATDILYIRKQHEGIFNTYTIIDMHGKALRSSQKLELDSISTDDLPNGVYFIHLSDGNGEDAWQNVVVQR